METPRILLCLALQLAYNRHVMRGVGRYRWATPCRLDLVPTTELEKSIEMVKPAGIIGHLTVGPETAAVVAAGVPTVGVSNMDPDPRLPRVCSDDEAVGRMAAQHLLERGYAQAAFAGVSTHAYSRERAAGFIKVVKEARVRFIEYDWAWPDPRPENHPARSQLGRWLAGLPQRTGIFAATDLQAFQILSTCADLGIKVPEQLAVLGVDNDEFLTTIARPPLSSIVLGGEVIGYKAAEMLDQMLGGGSRPAEPVRVPPVRVAARESTDIGAIDDEVLRKTIRFIRDHAHEPIGMEDVLEAVTESRSSLERRFRARLGRTPTEEIRRVRIENAKQMLVESELGLEAIAQQCGLGTARYLVAVFKTQTGMTPGSFRRQARGDGKASEE